MQSLALKSPHAPAFHQHRRRRISSVQATTTSPPVAAPPKLNRHSSRITEPKSQGASQAVLYGVGLSDEDLRKPQVGISSVWYEGNTCNMHLLRLSEAVREGVIEAGMVGFRFNTIGVSDAISMGTRGMCYSLQSRDLIADSIETVMAAQWYDANISIPGCDKNMPGTIMAMGRLNRPSIMVYGGTIKPGHHQGNSFDIVSAFQCYGEYVSGSISDEQRVNVLRNSCPGAGACGGMYTANTMASAIETMGMSLPYRYSSFLMFLKDAQPTCHSFASQTRVILGIDKGKVVIIRGEGPKGGPGMPEMLTPTSAIMGAGLGKECALLTDGRFSGGSHGFVVGHICPEAQEGGPIGLIQTGDQITIDVAKKKIDVNLTEEQLEERRKRWTPPSYKANRGVLYKYIKSVQSASQGCVTDE
ncbi:Dihydroxy-acid dehydratase [Carex littledalei]|uniref:dihydroxy-acid dehydratase n=1 Tax=Carex littledalei TaxID=544730 RepID=A0A833RIE2_9POAL|nr:Dihydroxy-acid dehydratase [Carex littledalei]